MLYLFTRKSLLFLVILLNFSELRAQGDTIEVTTIPIKADLTFIQAPEGFVPTDKFNGYLHPTASASIVLSMINDVNFIHLEEGMTEEYFAQNQLTKIYQQRFTAESGLNGVMFKATFMLEELEMVRYIVFIGDLNKTLWVSTTYPAKFDPILEKELLHSFTTVDFTKQ